MYVWRLQRVMDNLKHTISAKDSAHLEVWSAPLKNTVMSLQPILHDFFNKMLIVAHTKCLITVQMKMIQ